MDSPRSKSIFITVAVAAMLAAAAVTLALKYRGEKFASRGNDDLRKRAVTVDLLLDAAWTRPEFPRRLAAGEYLLNVRNETTARVIAVGKETAVVELLPGVRSGAIMIRLGAPVTFFVDSTVVSGTILAVKEEAVAGR